MERAGRAVSCDVGASNVNRRVSPSCPVPVRRAIMVQEWENLVYLHWAYNPEVVQSLLPKGLEVDTFDGAAYVGLIPFQMRGLGLPHLPAIPYLGTFPEVNVRTYVIRNGIPGVWFFSLDINRIAPTVMARTAYSLPYCFGKVSHEVRGSSAPEYVKTLVQRRWPTSTTSPATHLEIEVGEKIDDPCERDIFLSARWGLYSATRRGNVRYAAVEHEPWPLFSAHATRVEDTLVTAAGLPAPEGEPLALFSPGVSVRVGLPSSSSVG